MAEKQRIYGEAYPLTKISSPHSTICPRRAAPRWDLTALSCRLRAPSVSRMQWTPVFIGERGAPMTDGEQLLDNARAELGRVFGFPGFRHGQ